MRTGSLEYGSPHFAHASFNDYLSDPSRSGSFHVNRQDYENQVTTRCFEQPINYSQHDGISSSSRVLHTTTWDYFASHLPFRFLLTPEVVKKVIMTAIDDLVQEFWRTSSDGLVGASFFPMRRLLEILQRCFRSFKVCFDIISVFAAT